MSHHQYDERSIFQRCRGVEITSTWHAFILFFSNVKWLFYRTTFVIAFLASLLQIFLLKCNLQSLGCGWGGLRDRPNICQYMHKVATLIKFYCRNSGPLYLQKSRNSGDAMLYKKESLKEKKTGPNSLLLLIATSKNQGTQGMLCCIRSNL